MATVEKKKKSSGKVGVDTTPTFPSPYIEVLTGYRGRTTKEKYIAAGVYSCNDPALFGQERFLVQTKRAVWTRKTPPQIEEVEDIFEDEEEVEDEPESTDVPDPDLPPETQA